MTELAHAATWVMTGPVRPYSMDSRQAAMEPDRAGMANGLTWPGPLAWSVGRAVDDLLLAATAGVDRDGHPVTLVEVPGLEVQPCVRDRLLAGGHAQVDEAAHPARHLAIHGDGRVEALHLGRDAHVVAPAGRNG